jgi:hypothetical protein
MKTINIKSISAAHEVASTIAGVPADAAGVVVFDEKTGGAQATVRPGLDVTEIEFRGEYVSTARVSIERPYVDLHRGLTATTVRWSSSDSRALGTEDAAATARLLAFACAVAERLDAWAEDGALPYLPTLPTEEVTS